MGGVIKWKKIKLVYRRGVREQMNNTYIIREADSDDAEKMNL